MLQKNTNIFSGKKLLLLPDSRQSVVKTVTAVNKNLENPITYSNHYS